MWLARAELGIADPRFRGDLDLLVAGGLVDYDVDRAATELILWSAFRRPSNASGSGGHAPAGRQATSGAPTTSSPRKAQCALPGGTNPAGTARITRPHDPIPPVKTTTSSCLPNRSDNPILDYNLDYNSHQPVSSGVVAHLHHCRSERCPPSGVVQKVGLWLIISAAL